MGCSTYFSIAILFPTDYISTTQTVRFYDIAANEQKVKFDHRAAVLAMCFSDGGHAFSGCLDASVREYAPIWFWFILRR
jgi:hypothetical protein